MQTGKLRFFIIVLLWVLCLRPAPVHAAENGLFLESGVGYFKSLHTEAVLIRLDRETSPLFGKESFYEGFFAHWNGANHDDYPGIARGLRWRLTGDQYTSFAAGLGHIYRDTENLGMLFEFYFRLAYGIRKEHFDLSLGLIHISDGKPIFGWSGHDNGENFVTFSAGVLF